MSTHTLTRRQLMGGLAAGAASTAWRPMALAAAGTTAQSERAPYAGDVLPAGVRSRFVGNVNGLRMHVLEAGFETTGRPAVLLVHGFPELAYSWRKVMPHLAAAGYHVLAPDLRGYGRTDGTRVSYDDDLRPFRMLNEIRDMLSLVSAFGYRQIHLIGHDFGALVSAWCAVARPDVFHTVVLMSAPFSGTATLPFDTADTAPRSGDEELPTDIYQELAQLTPPRKHYRSYYSTRQANQDMWHAPQGVHAFLRGYYHMKSADWPENQPYPLQAWSATELAELPHYYVMELDKGMPETVAAEMPSAADIATCEWLPDHELRVYSDDWGIHLSGLSCWHASFKARGRVRSMDSVDPSASQPRDGLHPVLEVRLAHAPHYKDLIARSHPAGPAISATATAGPRWNRQTWIPSANRPWLEIRVTPVKWIPPSDEYVRTGFQGGLQWYRSNTSVSSLFGAGGINADLQVFAGRTIDQPSLFIAGKSDWGIYQRPDALDRLQDTACTDLKGVHLLDGAGHWVQQEQPEAVIDAVLSFLANI